MGCIVDTNVAAVAEGLTEQADAVCVNACAQRLVTLCRTGGLVLAEGDEIVAEYVGALGHAGQPGIGRAFVKWAWDRRFDPAAVRLVQIAARTRGGWRRYEEFPDCDGLRGFDPNDQKFVAVAVAAGKNPPILNAVDSDWWEHRHALRGAGIRVEFLCPQHAPAGKGNRCRDGR